MSVDNKFNLSSTCRLCANSISNSVLFPLHYSVESNKEPPIAIIQKYTNSILKIKKDDNLPQQVCFNCLNKFSIINDFFTGIINAQERLQNYFNTKSLIENIKIELFDFEENESILSESDSYQDNYFYEFSDSDSSDTYFNDNFSEDFRFICHICNMELKTAFQLDKHFKEHNIKENDNILCEHCGQNFSKKIYLRHIKQANLGISYSCEYCDKKFLSKRALCQHYDSQHSKHKSINKDVLYPCSICQRKFKTFVYMRKHEIMAHNSKREQNPRYKPHSCGECGQVYGRSDHLQIHIKRVHLKKMDHKCNYCGKCYSQGFELNQHVKLTHCVKPIFTCKLCSKEYLNLKRYKEHLSEHSDEPSFKCVLCGLLFHKSTELKKHEALHDKEGRSSLLKLNSKTNCDNSNNVNKVNKFEEFSRTSLINEDDFENFEIDLENDEDTE